MHNNTETQQNHCPLRDPMVQSVLVRSANKTVAPGFQGILLCLTCLNQREAVEVMRMRIMMITVGCRDGRTTQNKDGVIV